MDREEQRPVDLYAIVADRVWSEPLAKAATPEAGRTRGQGKRPASPAEVVLSGPVLVLDTETTVDTAQALTFGSAVVGHYREPHPDKPGDPGELVTLERIMFYADDLPTRMPAEFAELEAYADTTPADVSRVVGAKRDITLISRFDFIHKYMKDAMMANGRVVAYNMPFDLSRLCVGATYSRGKKTVGGFSMRLFSLDMHYPRLHVKAGMKCAEYSLGSTARGQSWMPKARPQFLDLATLGFALHGTAYSLAGACKAFDVVQAKFEADGHGVVTRDYIDYNLRDVTATAELFVRMMKELSTHHLDVYPEQLRSSASVGKKYLQNVFGLRPRLEVQPDFDRDVLGKATSTFIGGRAEVMIRRAHVPVQVHDFTSMYPTVNALMEIWHLDTADRIEHRDSTAVVVALLDRLTVDDLFDVTLWPKLCHIVEVVPDFDVLPIRTHYGQVNDQARNIGVNHLTSKEPTWYTLADVVASKLITGRTPTILRGIEFVPVGTMPSLKVGKLGGNLREAIEIDPRSVDPFQVGVEQRASTVDGVKVKSTPVGAFLKVFLNATSYGMHAEFNAAELATDSTESVNVFNGIDAGGFISEQRHPETAGRWCFPPVATLITGGARLMLALVEIEVVKRGGSWAFSDTDSFAIVARDGGGLIECPGGAYTLDGVPAAKALTLEETAEVRAKFDTMLNPYDRDLVPTILKPEYTGTCWAVSAKRYCVYNIVDGVVVVGGLDDKGQHVPAAKEHGLGHLLDPTVGMDDPDRPLDENRQSWVSKVWRYLVERDLGMEPPEPSWFANPAVGRFGVRTPHVHSMLRHLNSGVDYSDQVKPFGFVLTASMETSRVGVLSPTERVIAPYERDSSKWSSLPWTSTSTGEPITGGLKSVGQVVREYEKHPENSFKAPDGGDCMSGTRGLLQRKHVYAVGREYIGKEANRIEEAAGQMLEGEPTPVYSRTDVEWELVRDRLAHLGIEHVVAELAKISQAITARQVRYIIAGESPGSNRTRHHLKAIALRGLKGGVWLEKLRRDVHHLAHWKYVEQTTPGCTCGCGQEPRGRSRWASDACRKRHSRAGQRTSSAVD